MKVTQGFSLTLRADARDLCSTLLKFALQGKFSSAGAFQPKLQECVQESRLVQLNEFKMYVRAVSKGRTQSWDRFSPAIKLSLIRWLHQACTDFKLKYLVNFFLFLSRKEWPLWETPPKELSTNSGTTQAVLCSRVTEARWPRTHRSVTLSYTIQTWNKATWETPCHSYTTKPRDQTLVLFLPAACSHAAGSRCKLDMQLISRRCSHPHSSPGGGTLG